MTEPTQIDVDEYYAEYVLDDALYQARVASAILSELSSRHGHEAGDRS